MTLWRNSFSGEAALAAEASDARRREKISRRPIQAGYATPIHVTVWNTVAEAAMTAAIPNAAALI